MEDCGLQEVTQTQVQENGRRRDEQGQHVAQFGLKTHKTEITLKKT